MHAFFRRNERRLANSTQTVAEPDGETLSLANEIRAFTQVHFEVPSPSRSQSSTQKERARVLDHLFPEQIYRRAADEARVRCSICLGRVKEGHQVVRAASCNHVFHRHCALEWMQKSNECPNCRTVMWNSETYNLIESEINETQSLNIPQEARRELELCGVSSKRWHPSSFEEMGETLRRASTRKEAAKKSERRERLDALAIEGFVDSRRRNICGPWEPLSSDILNDRDSESKISAKEEPPGTDLPFFEANFD